MAIHSFHFGPVLNFTMDKIHQKENWLFIYFNSQADRIEFKYNEQCSFLQREI